MRKLFDLANRRFGHLFLCFNGDNVFRRVVEQFNPLAFGTVPVIYGPNPKEESTLLWVFHRQECLLVAVFEIWIVGSVRVAWELCLCLGPFAVVTEQARLVHANDS